MRNPEEENPEPGKLYRESEPGNKLNTPVAEKVRRIERGNQNRKEPGPSKKPGKKKGKSRQPIPGQQRILDFFQRKADKEAKTPPKTTHGASNGPITGVLDLCASKPLSKEDTHPFPE